MSAVDVEGRAGRHPGQAALECQRGGVMHAAAAAAAALSQLESRPLALFHRLQTIAKAGRWSPEAHHHWPEQFKAVTRLLLVAGRHGSGGGARVPRPRRSRRGRSAADQEAVTECLLPVLPRELLLRVIKKAADPCASWLQPEPPRA